MEQETDLRRAIWLKAYNEGSISLTYPTYGEANRVRLSLYNAAKAVRDNPFEDPAFHKAVRVCELVTEKLDGGGGRLSIRKRSENPLLKEAARQLNLDPDAFNTESTAEEELIKRIMDSPDE